MSGRVTTVLLVGIGGQGVLKASDILARAAFLSGFDVKKSEVHGMSQRGGGVKSAVRFGEKVFSPLLPEGGADVLLALDVEEGAKYEGSLADGGRAIFQDERLLWQLPDARCGNVALLGVAASVLDIEDQMWEKAVSLELPERYVKMNIDAFRKGRSFKA